MPTKHDTAPKWSDEELKIAADFQQFVAIHKDTEEEKLREKNWYIRKCDRLTHSFVSLYQQKYSSLRGKDCHKYSDLPLGVKSAASHLAALARQKREFARRVKRAQQELELAWEQHRGDARFLIEHADPEELDKLLSCLPLGGG